MATCWNWPWSPPAPAPPSVKSPTRWRSRSPVTAPSTVSPQPDGSRDPQSFLFSLAPYLTEGGFSFFVGFCLGYFLRLLAKTAMLIVGAVYCCLIILSHYGIITVDWGSFQQILHSLLLNTQTQVESVRQVIQVGLPSAAMGGIGVWRGLKKS